MQYVKGDRVMVNESYCPGGRHLIGATGTVAGTSNGFYRVLLDNFKLPLSCMDFLFMQYELDSINHEKGD